MRNQQETSSGFSQRKKDHIEISLRQESQAFVDQFSSIELQHNAIPEINFDEVNLSTEVFGAALRCPLFISSMTLGHEDAARINETLMKLSEERGWMMGVGSQRRQLFDSEAKKECESLRSRFPKAILFGNIGLSQVITESVESIQFLVESLGAQFLVVHTNPLQEAIQPEGTPQFSGGLQALTGLCEKLSCPVVLKETGCGFSQENFVKLKTTGLSAIDVSGRGGTHWGRVEALRYNKDQMGFLVGETFAHWGISTVDSLENGIKSDIKCELWASGGVRSGLDAAKLLALGASKVGLAQPLLKAAMQGEESLRQSMLRLEQELQVAMFCLGIETLQDLVGKRDLLRWK